MHSFCVCVFLGLPCGPPPKIPNANMYNVLNSYQYGQKYTYSCLNGFGIQGPASVECEGRKWSPEPECTSIVYLISF